MSIEGFHVGTTPADTAYHACRATPRQVKGGQLVRALCGMPCRVTPRPWDEERQGRQDSCRSCVGRIGKILDADARERAKLGPLVAGYIRASTDGQVESPDVQEQIIRDYCERLALQEPQLYVDAAVSGSKPIMDRPAGRELIRHLRRGDHVVIARVDRLSRNFIDFASTIDTWARMGVTLHPCDFPMVIKPDDPLSMAFIQMLGIFANYERRMIATRTREALQWRIGQGRKHAAEPPYGWRWEKRSDGHSYKVVDEYEAAICIKCVELTIAGYTQTQIADYLNREWGVRNRRSTVHAAGQKRRYLVPQDPARRGLFVQQKIGKLIDNGLEIMQLRGMPLPEGVQTRKDLMQQ